jgi:hypothetical protein
MIRAYLSNNPVHDRVIRAFAQGCNAKLVEGWKYEPAEVAVVFGVKKDRIPQSWARGKIIDKQRRDGGKVLVLETGYINRGDGPDAHYAAGWGGINGRADFRNANSLRDRWELLGVGLREWRDVTPRVVVCAQIPHDASVQFTDHRGWCQMVSAHYSRHTGCQTLFRPHPLAKGVDYGVHGVEFSDAPLAHDLEIAGLVVTFNSNAAVEAVIAGVPAISMDHGSMAFGVTSHDLVLPENAIRPDRTQWAWDLAHTQWTLDEFRSGLAWAQLSK